MARPRGKSFTQHAQQQKLQQVQQQPIVETTNISTTSTSNEVTYLFLLGLLFIIAVILL